MNGNAASQPQFSVIIPTYNRKDYVLEAVRSVVEQTYPAHELIVVVDGSTDGTAEALRERFPQVKVIEQPNRGPSVARNAGIAAATGEWVAFLDDDDLLHRDFLAKVRHYLGEHPDCCALNTYSWFFSTRRVDCSEGYCLRRDFVADSLEECHRQTEGHDHLCNDFAYMHITGKSFANLLARNAGSLTTSVVSRAIAITAGGFSCAQNAGEDWLFFLNVARLTEWHTLPQALAFHRLHTSNLTADSTNGLKVLAGLSATWHSGRPLPEPCAFPAYLEMLTTCGPIYRRMAQEYFWGAVRRGHFRLARLILLCGYLLLPRLRDRLYVLIPPQITWRWERYVLGMHR